MPRRARDKGAAKAETFVKTSLKLPESLWRAAHIRALTERTDLQTVIAQALEAYLGKTKRGGE